jgi:hypothetical protein
MHWGAVLAASITDLFRDIDYLFFSHSGRREMSLRPPRCIPFFSIIWSLSHVYDLFDTTCSLWFSLLIFATVIMDCRIGPCGVASVDWGWLVYTWRVETESWRLGWLCQLGKAVFLSRKAATVDGHCPPLNPPNIALGISRVLDTIQYIWLHRSLFTSLSPGHTVQQCASLGLVTASCQQDTSFRQGDGFKLPADVTYTHSPPFLSLSSSSFPSPTTSTAVPWSSLHPFSGNTSCPLLRNIESISSRPCVSHSIQLSSFSLLRKLS